MLQKVHTDPKSNGTKNAAEEDIWGGKNFLDFVKIQNGKQRYNQKTEHFEDPLCADPLSAPKTLSLKLSFISELSTEICLHWFAKPNSREHYKIGIWAFLPKVDFHLSFLFILLLFSSSFCLFFLLLFLFFFFLFILPISLYLLLFVFFFFFFFFCCFFLLPLHLGLLPLLCPASCVILVTQMEGGSLIL